MSPTRATRTVAARLALGLLAAGGLLSTGGAPAGAAPSSSPRELDSPSGLAVDGGHLWVTNAAGNSVTEIDPASGRWLRTVRAARYGFDRPSAIAAVGGDLWVVNSTGSLTELRAGDAGFVRRVGGRRYGLDHPVSVKADGATVLVLDAGHGAVPGGLTEIDASSGRLLRRVAGARFALADPVAMSLLGPDLWVADHGGDTVTELAVRTGRLVRVVRGGGLAGPAGISNGAGHVWVTDQATSAATEIDAANGRVLRTVTDSTASYGFGHPTVMIGNGRYVFAATPLGTSPMVTKLSAATGVPSWYMCNTNGPYYFSELSAFAFTGGDLWVASRSGANDYKAPRAASATGSLTELRTTDGGLVRTLP